MPGFSNVTGDESILFADNASFDGTERGGALSADGQLWIGSASGRSVRAGTLTSSDSIDVENGAGSITLVAGSTVATSYVTDSGTAIPSSNSLTFGGGIGTATRKLTSSEIVIDVIGGGVEWNEVTDTSENMEPSNSYVANNASLVTLTLPSSCSFGDVMEVVTKGEGLVKIAQNASQTIRFGTLVTTTGVSGSITATEVGDVVKILCIGINEFYIMSSIGNWTIV